MTLLHTRLSLRLEERPFANAPATTCESMINRCLLRLLSLFRARLRMYISTAWASSTLMCCSWDQGHDMIVFQCHRKAG